MNVSGTPSVKENAKSEDVPATEAVLNLNAIRTEIDTDASVSSNDRPFWFFGVLFGAPLLFLGGLLGERWRTARAEGAGSRAARGAAGGALNALSQVERTGGYEAVHRIVIQYLTARFEGTFNGKTYAQIGQVISQAGASQQAVNALAELLETLDYARFTRADDEDDLNRTVDSARAVIHLIEETIT